MKPLRRMYTHSHYPVNLVYRDSAGIPIDITGATGTLVMRRSLHGTPDITKTATVNGPNGAIDFVIAPEDTNDLLGDKDSETYFIGAVLTLADSSIVHLFQTTVELTKNVVITA